MNILIPILILFLGLGMIMIGIISSILLIPFSWIFPQIIYIPIFFIILGIIIVAGSIYTVLKTLFKLIEK